MEFLEQLKPVEFGRNALLLKECPAAKVSSL
jgi:hypothetical protein